MFASRYKGSNRLGEIKWIDFIESEFSGLDLIQELRIAAAAGTKGFERQRASA